MKTKSSAAKKAAKPAAAPSSEAAQKFPRTYVSLGSAIDTAHNLLRHVNGSVIEFKPHSVNADLAHLNTVLETIAAEMGGHG